VTDLRQHPETPQHRDGPASRYRAAGADVDLTIEKAVTERVQHARPERRDLGLMVSAAIHPQRPAGRSGCSHRKELVGRFGQELVFLRRIQRGLFEDRKPGEMSLVQATRIDAGLVKDPTEVRRRASGSVEPLQARSAELFQLFRRQPLFPASCTSGAEELTNSVTEGIGRATR
jgi:hypothetical protein